MSAIAIIPARGGSRRIPRKNLKEFHGKPIIAYSIDVAHDSKLFQRVVVSTDDDEIAEVAEHYGAEVHRRDPAYARDEVGTQEVARECLSGLRYSGTLTCVIYATSPLLSVLNLKRGASFVNRWNPRYAISVGATPFPLRDAGQFYWGPPAFFMDRILLRHPNTAAVLIREGRVCDINTIEDWRCAEKMYAKLKREGEIA